MEGLTSNFHIFNSTKSSEDDISTVIKGISNSIFSVLLAPSVSEESSVSLAPLIVSLLGGPAESVSRKLDRRIRDYNLDLAKNIPESKKPGVDFKVQRPLVIVIDRSVDIGAMLSHHSAYNALVQDVLGVGGTGQRVSIPPGDSTSPSKDASTSRHHDLDARDWFWQSNRSILFPTVADNMDSALKDYLKEEEQVRGRGSTNPDAMSAEELRVAISVLPELAEKKRIIWAHRQICVALLDAIKKRTLADLIHLQSSSTLDPKKVLDILSSSNTSGPTAMDKMRLFLIFFMKNYTLNDNLMNFKPYEDVLKAGGCDMRPVEFCKKFCSFLGRSARIFEESSSFSPLAATINRVKSPISSTSTNQGDLLQRITGAGGLFGTMMMSSVRSLMTDTPQAVTPITRIIDAALESAVSGASTIPGRIGLIDPRNSNSEVSISGANPQRTAFDHIIIYLVGGTNYAEYNHVSDFIKHQKRVVPASISSSSSVRFTFGSTDFVSPEQFLTTLSEIN